MYDFMPILARLKAAKHDSGMTNAELSTASGVSLGTLNKILSGDTSEPKLPALMSIAHALGVSVDYLIYGKTEKPVPKDELSADERELLSILRQLNAEAQERVIEYADLLLRSGNYGKKNDAHPMAARQA